MQSILEKQAFSQRLRTALARIGDDGASPTRIAQEFNRRYAGKAITLHAARKWLQGESIPAQEKLRVLADWLAVAPEWLRFGDGSPATPVTQLAATPVIDYVLAREIATLTKVHQNVVRATVAALLVAEGEDG